MTRTQLYMPQSQYAGLKQLAASEGKTFAELVRELLDINSAKLKKTRSTNSRSNKISLWLKSLKKIEKYNETGVVRRWSIDHDKILYSKSAIHGK